MSFTAQATDRCACGSKLHYNSLSVMRHVQRVIERKGETILVQVGVESYAVQRHYLALHGLRAVDLPELARKGVVDRVT